MVNPHIAPKFSDTHAEGVVQQLFGRSGWHVEKIAGSDGGPDFLLSGHGKVYHVVLKALAEGRADRVTPLFAQALLEARRHAGKKHSPAVIFWVGSASSALIKRLRDFHQEYGNGEPFALLSPHGPVYADFPGFEGLIDEDAPIVARHSVHSHSASAPLVFSDLAQWMLKLLLATDLKRAGLINAPDRRYRTATELAEAAGASVMTATRLINALKDEGFIETVPTLRLVQRRRLAERWKAVYLKPVVSRPMKFLNPAVEPEVQLEKLIKREQGIAGLFYAANLLGVGHVHGAVPAVWVAGLDSALGWRGVRPALDGERPDVTFHQHAYPRSLTHGAVQIGNVHVSDVIQTWLDVSAHATRGAEQADELEQGILAGVIGAHT